MRGLKLFLYCNLVVYSSGAPVLCRALKKLNEIVLQVVGPEYADGFFSSKRYPCGEESVSRVTYGWRSIAFSTAFAVEHPLMNIR